MRCILVDEQGFAPENCLSYSGMRVVANNGFKHPIYWRNLSYGSQSNPLEIGLTTCCSVVTGSERDTKYGKKTKHLTDVEILEHMHVHVFNA